MCIPGWLVEEQHEHFRVTDYWCAVVDADYADNIDWLGTNIHESFKAPGNTSRWYGSFCAVCKALDENYRESLSAHEKYYCDSKAPESELRDTHLFLGAVVLDGPLHVALLTNAGEIELKEAEIAPFDFHLHTATYKPCEYRLDVVQLDNLGGYLGMLEAWHEAFRTAIVKELKGQSDANKPPEGTR